MRRSLFLVLPGLLLGLALPAIAQNDNPRCNVYGGYYYVRANVSFSGTSTTSTGTGAVALAMTQRNGDPTESFNFNGGGGQFACNVTSWLGGVADVAGYTTSSNGASGTVVSYMFGPRVTLPGHTFAPFVQGLFGGAHESSGISGTGNSQNVFALALGGGIDINVTRRFFIRPIQAEYFLTKFNTGFNSNQNNFRYSAGVGFRFP